MLPNRNPRYINEISQLIFLNAPANLPPLANSVSIIEQKTNPTSYSPSINKELVMLQSIEREKVHDCNNEKAFDLKEPLQIGIPGQIYGKTCVPYYNDNAIKFLLKNCESKYSNQKKNNTY